MFLGTFTLRIPLIDFPSAKTTETTGMETETPSDSGSESLKTKASGMGTVIPSDSASMSLRMGATGMETETPSNSGSESLRMGNCEALCVFPPIVEICEVGNQSATIMIEEIGDSEVMPECPNTTETGTPHEAFNDKDIEDLICALSRGLEAQKENTETTDKIDADIQELLKLDLNHFFGIGASY